MSAYSDQVREYMQRYLDEVGPDTGLIDPHELAAWAYQRGLMKPNLGTIIDAIAVDIAQVFREEYRTDAMGRRYRAKHAVKRTILGKTRSLWADMDDQKAPRGHFLSSFADRRRQIVGDCLQLKTDVDVYNDKNPQTEPIQMPLNFTDDVEELQLLNRPMRDAA